MNPLAGNKPMMQQLANLMNAARGNPQAVIQQMAQKNPQVAQAIQQMLQSGQNPQLVAQNMLRQRGIDPQQFMGMLNGR